MEAELGDISPTNSLADPYDLAMAQMHAHMLLAERAEDFHSLDAASGHSDEELRIIMEPESRAGFRPLSMGSGDVVGRGSTAAPAAKVARSETSGLGAAKGGTSGTKISPASPEERSPWGPEQRKSASIGLNCGKENKSRARPRKPHEPPPFLSIDTVPTDKPRGVPISTRERSAGSQKGSVIARRKQMTDHGARQARAPPGTPAHPVFNVHRSSRMGRSASSAVSSEWNPLVPRQKPLAQVTLENPVNRHVKAPFKHSVNQPDIEKVPRPMSPGQTMKERTTLATFHLARTMAKQRGEEETKAGGRLLKGRLKPLYPVRVEGPSIHHCKGVVAEDNSLMNSNSRTLERRRKIVAGMLNKDFLYERPQTAESVHHTSVASDLSEGRDKDIQQQLEEQEKVENVTSPVQDGMREPPNSLASVSDPNCRLIASGPLASASGLSSDVFEIDEIPKPSPAAPSTAIAAAAAGAPGSIIEEVSVSSENTPGQAMASTVGGGRPSTAKAVRFADNEPTTTNPLPEKAADEPDERQQDKVRENGSCKPPTDGDLKRPDREDDDNEGSGGGQGPSQGQSDGQGRVEGQARAQTEGQDESSSGKGGGGPQDENEYQAVREEKLHTAGTDNSALTASYNTVLYTSENISFPRAGTVRPPKPKKSKKKKHPKARVPSSSRRKASVKVTDFGIVRGGRESPTKDYYKEDAPLCEQTAADGRRRPRSASGRILADSQKKSSSGPLLLRRPVSASVSAKDRQSKAQFLIRPKDSQSLRDAAADDDSSIRLNEIKSSLPLSARTQTSGLVSTGRSTPPTTSIKSTVRPPREAKSTAEATADFRVEGAKMAQTLKTGVCTECRRPTNKIADYWEETGALVCEVCDRRTRAEEQRKIDWVRHQMERVYHHRPQDDEQLEAGGEQQPPGEELMLTEHGEPEGGGSLHCLADLEKALGAVQAEIGQALEDVREGSVYLGSEDEGELDNFSEGDDEEIRAVTFDEQPFAEQNRADKEGGRLIDEEADKIIEGQISRTLTEMDVDPTSLSQYEMRVYWYKEYRRLRERQKNKQEMVKRKQQQQQQQQEQQQGNFKTNATGNPVYNELKSVTGQMSSEVDNKLNDITKKVSDVKEDAVQTLFNGQPTDGATTFTGRVQHFKGERTPHDALCEMDKMNIEVSGTATKLCRNRSAKKSPRPAAVAPFAPLCFRINARPPPGFLYYFAYGPSMSADRMEMYIGRSVAADRLWGLLYGFGLVFNKRGVDLEAGAFANVELQAGGSVEGCLYLITLEELDKVDRHLGYPQHYDHAMLPVWLLNCSEPEQHGVAQYCVPALVFVSKDEWIHRRGNGHSALPNEYIVEQCKRAGEDLLTPAYRDHLESLKVCQVAC